MYLPLALVSLGSLAETAGAGFLECSLMQILEAVTEIIHHLARVGFDAFVDGYAELYRASVTENAHAYTYVAALGDPEHGLNQFAARQVNRMAWSGNVGQNC
ncbi:hypothetical protein; putative exported protein [Marinobacter nauticus ATCC 49840]|nr:hypothetical protein; putative exported protein [Marinobacter nauticus ATCC 49840]